MQYITETEYSNLQAQLLKQERVIAELLKACEDILSLDSSNYSNTVKYMLQRITAKAKEQ